MNNAGAFDLLCACLSVSDDPAHTVVLRRYLEHNAVDWPAIVGVASSALVTTNLRSALVRRNLLAALPADVLTYFDGVHELNTERNRRLLAQLEAAAQALNAAGITPLLLKGMANLLAEVYPDTGTRLIGDIDMQVGAGQLESSANALSAAGFRPLRDIRQDMHLQPMARPGDIAHVELHTRVHTGRVGELLATNELLAEAVPMRAGEAQVLVPSPTHRVLHNIIHTQIQDANFLRVQVCLRQLSDLVALQRRYGDDVNWTLVQDRLSRAGYAGALSHYAGWGERLLSQPRAAAVARRRSEGLAHIVRRVQLRSRPARLTANTVTKVLTSLGWLRREPRIARYWLHALNRKGHLRLTFRRLGFHV